MVAVSPYLERNSQAVELLQQGKIAEASGLLRNALGGLQMELIKHSSVAAPSTPGPSAPQQQQAAQEEDFSCFVYGSLYAVSVPMAEQAAQRILAGSNPDKHIFGCYPRAMEVDENVMADITPSTAFVVLVYNLSLALFIQQAGMPRQTNNMAENPLYTSITLLQAGLQTADQLWNQEYKEENLFLLLALINNLGFFLSLLTTDYDESNQRQISECLTVISRMMMHHDAPEDVIPTEDYDFFVTHSCLYYMSIQQQQFMNTAAAA